MSDWKAMVAAASCDANMGCGTMKQCVCALAEDMVDEIERLQGRLSEFIKANAELAVVIAEKHERLAEAERLLRKTNYYLAKWYPELASEIYQFLGSTPDNGPAVALVDVPRCPRCGIEAEPGDDCDGCRDPACPMDGTTESESY